MYIQDIKEVMDMSNVLTREAMATRGVAMRICNVAPGERIPTVTELVDQCSSSRGNIQKALVNLREAGAVSLEPHGQNGTILISIDYLKLAGICGKSHMIGAMPLPYTPRYEGLATCLFTLLNTELVKSYITFQRGSEARVQTLIDGATDYCVMSLLAYENYVTRSYPVELALDCGQLSYVGRHAVFTREKGREDWNGAKVGIDASSVDQTTLTKRYFANYDVEYVPVQYTSILDMVRSGALDAGVWNEDDLRIDMSDLEARPIDISRTEENTHAAIVVRKGDGLTRQVLRTLIDIPALRSMQQQVIAGEITARY